MGVATAAGAEALPKPPGVFMAIWPQEPMDKEWASALQFFSYGMYKRKWQSGEDRQTPGHKSPSRSLVYCLTNRYL